MKESQKVVYDTDLGPEHTNNPSWVTSLVHAMLLRHDFEYELMFQLTCFIQIL